MNVDYKHLNCADVARMLKVDRTSVALWCRNKYIDAIDVSEPGSKKARYQIAEEEVERVKKLLKKYGKHRWTKHCNEGRNEMLYPDYDELEQEEEALVPVSIPKKERIQFNVALNQEDEEILKEKCEELNVSKSEYIRSLIRGDNRPHVIVEYKEQQDKPSFDADKFLNQVLRIQEIKERLDNLEAERNQLTYELADIKKEMIEVI